MIPGKEVFEFTPVFLWDQASSCIGRWLDIEESEVEMLRMAVKLSARGLGSRMLTPRSLAFSLALR